MSEIQLAGPRLNASAIERDLEPPLLSVIVCTLDEAQSIGPVLDELREALAGIAHEVVVVDDSVDERTAAAVLAHAATNKRVRLLRRKGENGLASAAIDGWDIARGGVLAIMDGDGQHDPHLLPLMLDRLRDTRADILVASRYAGEGPSGLKGRRHIVSRMGTLLTRIMLGVSSTDPLSGLFMFTRDCFKEARPRLSGVGFKILVDMMASGRSRPKLVEVSTALRPRRAGSSKLDSRVVLELAALLVEKRTRGFVPARFCLFAAVGSTGLAVHLGALALATASADLPFWTAQALATFAAMTSNFFLNNALTFRDRRLSGRALWLGLATFSASCAGGALLSEVVGSGLAQAGVHWLTAGITGAFAAALWNYVAAEGATWRHSSKPAKGLAIPAPVPASPRRLAPRRCRPLQPVVDRFAPSPD